MPHTPGPWKIDGGRGKHGDLYIWQNVKGIMGEHAIATVHEEMVEGAQGNALLIAAAPELLEALRESISVYETHRDAQPTGYFWPDPNYITHARAAIQKTTGEK